MDNLIIVGTSKTASHVYAFVQYHKLYNIIGFAVNEKYKDKDTFCSLPVYSLEKLSNSILGNFYLFVAMLWNHLNGDRKNLYDYCKLNNFKLANLISPLAVIEPLIGQVAPPLIMTFPPLTISELSICPPIMISPVALISLLA